MCNKHQIVNTVNSLGAFIVDSVGSTKESALKKKPVRTKLWQLDHNYHCAVIGTCLTMAEVKKLLNSFHVDCKRINAYDIHTTIVTMIAYNDFRSKKVQNYLDKKFSTVIQKTKKMDAQELRTEWKSVLNTGDLVGTFWAVMSHPLTDEKMKRDFYGDIHMLSHLSGASNRVDLKRLSQLEKERIGISKEINFEQSRTNKLTADNLCLNTKVKNLKDKSTGLTHQIAALEKSNTKLMDSQNVKEHQLLNQQVEKLKKTIIAQENEIRKQQSNKTQLDNLVTQLKHQQLRNESEISIYQEEAEYLQYLLSQQNKHDDCQFKKQGLCGRCVLYVGGKKNLIPHYRELVEEKAGVFLHHDGGQEKNTQALSQMLTRADVVIFPSDCISHEAYWKIKRSCKKQQKPFEYLNSPGLYSLSSMLDKLGDASEMH